MSTGLFDKLNQEGLISTESLGKSKTIFGKPVLSLRKDLNVILYTGVVLLSSGLSILVYKNIDSIGHLAIVTFIAFVCIFCYTYCWKKSLPFSWEETDNKEPFFDYLLVLGGLTMLTFTGYLQYQFHVFGETWNIAAFIPMILLFITAYYFDQLGVLSLAITNLAAWFGIAINRVKWPFLYTLNENHTIYTAIILGIFLIGMAYFSRFSNLKSHFKNLYHQFGTHIFFIATIIAVFHFDQLYWPWILLLLAGSAYHFFKAYFESSFYYLIVAVLYAYIGVSYLITDIIKQTGASNQVNFQWNLVYFVISSAALAYLLIRVNNTFKKNAGV
jgi:Predicted membrane protein (DUF2157)